MGNKYNHQRRSSFMQMLCLRPSASDGRFGIVDNGVVPFSDLNKFDYVEPASPRVGCMGQIKRKNKVAGFPSHHHRYNHPNSNSKYSKLNRFFSSKSLITTTTTTTIISNSKKQMIMGESAKTKLDDEGSYVSIINMDPPLPVHRANRDGSGGSAVSLWKRRGGGEALKCLQLQQKTTLSSSSASSTHFHLM